MNNRKHFGIKPGLERITAASQLLGSPQNGYKSVLVAGTNGKGSTTKAISTLLINKGFKVGTYLSPHLEEYTERFLINNQEICQTKFAEIIAYMSKSKEINGLELTEFEVLTLMSFIFFLSEKVDYAIFEVGLGGRFDATNIVNPECAVITPIGFDHKDILGNTITQIAMEKAGIIKKGKPVFTVEQEVEVLGVLERIAQDNYVDMRIVKTDNIPGVSVAYQNQNFSLAVEVAKYVLSKYNVFVTEEDLSGLVSSFSFPGRFEVIADNVIIDGAHNQLGMAALLTAIDKKYTGKNINFIVGILKRKEPLPILDEMLQLKNNTIESVSFVAIPNENCWLPEDLELELRSLSYHGKIISGTRLDEVVEWINDTVNDGIFVLCGSLYLVGAIKTLLKNQHIINV